MTQAFSVIPLVETMVNYHDRILHQLENSLGVVQLPVGRWDSPTRMESFDMTD